MPGVRGEVEWVARASDGTPLESGCARNLFLDQGRSAYAGVLRGLLATAPRWIWFGTGTAQPAITDTGLQFRVSAKALTASAQDGTYTARLATQLGTTQMTGVLTELLLAQDSAHPTTAWAKAMVSATHRSGTTLDILWRIAMEA